MMELLAQVPTVSFGEIGNFSVTAAAVLVILNTAFAFWKEHMREQPRPGDTYVAIPDFEKVERERKEDRRQILAKLDKIETELLESNRYQAMARQGIHRRMNGMDAALSFIAGRFERDGDHTAAEAITQKLHASRGGCDG